MLRDIKIQAEIKDMSTCSSFISLTTDSGVATTKTIILDRSAVEKCNNVTLENMPFGFEAQDGWTG